MAQPSEVQLVPSHKLVGARCRSQTILQGRVLTPTVRGTYRARKIIGSPVNFWSDDAFLHVRKYVVLDGLLLSALVVECLSE